MHVRPPRLPNANRRVCVAFCFPLCASLCVCVRLFVCVYFHPPPSHQPRLIFTHLFVLRSPVPRSVDQSDPILCRVQRAAVPGR